MLLRGTGQTLGWVARKHLKVGVPSAFSLSASSSLSLPHGSPLFLPTTTDMPVRTYKAKVKTRYPPAPPSPREIPPTRYPEELSEQYSDPVHGEKWFPSEKQIGELLVHEDYYKVVPEGAPSFVNTCQFLKEKPTFLYREITHNVINQLYEMWDGGFSDVASVNQTIYIDGIKGCGKSVTVAQAVLWARKNGWLVFYVRDGIEWIDLGEQIVHSSMKDCFNQVNIDENGPAIQLLSMQLKSQRDILKTISLKQPHPNLPDFDSEGKTLEDLAEYGAHANEATAAEVLLAYRSELNYVTEVPVLVAVDGYSALEGSSEWYDPDEADWYNAHKKYPAMPADRLSFTRMLLLNDDGGHGLLNGAYLVSRENESGRRSKDFMTRSGRALQDRALPVDAMTLKQSTFLIRYYRQAGVIARGHVSVDTCKYIHQISQGLPGEVYGYAKAII